MKLQILSVLCIALITIALDPKTVIELGNKIEEEINEMDGNKESIKANFMTYRRYMKRVLKLLKEDSPEGKLLYFALEDNIGPPHISIPIYSILNQDIYNWTSLEVKKLEKVIDDTIDVWSEIENVVSNKTIQKVSNVTVEQYVSKNLLQKMANLTMENVSNGTRRDITIHVINDTIGEFFVSE